jgi:hypothetical protein
MIGSGSHQIPKGIAMSDQPDLAGVHGDLCRGAKEICLEIYGVDDEPTVRRLYHEQDRWPVFKLDESGVLYALRSRIKAHLLAKSMEKEAAIAAAVKSPAPNAAPLKRRRRKAQRRLGG